MLGRHFLKAFVVAAMPLLVGCNSVSNVLNPFYEPPSEVALMGEKNDRAIGGREEKVNKARVALETMASYQRAHDPQPVNPVMNPAVVRVMWIPDHLNKSGDLVPAHYYYLKVRDDYWAVTDAFELESQLGSTTKGSSNIPYVHAEDQF